MRNLASSVDEACREGTGLLEAHQSMAQQLKIKLEQQLDDYNQRNSERPMFKVFLDYMELIETILNFIRATRQANWDLHLSSLERLARYFFVLDRIKYARMVPLYLAEMKSLQQTHRDVWAEFQSGNFVVNKNDVEFRAIGPDHAIEHANRWMKVSGGLTGIKLNESARNRLFYTAPELARLAEEAEATAKSQTNVRQHHHKLSVSLTEAQDKQVSQLLQVISPHNPFTFTGDGLVSLISQAVMPDSIVKDMCSITTKGDEAYSSFVKDRITDGNINLWNPMKRLSLHTWKYANKTVVQKTGSQVMELKGERNLFARCLIVARSRPEIDVREALEKYEFTSVPRSLFDCVGDLLPMTDKSKLMHILEATTPREPDQANDAGNQENEATSSVPQEDIRTCTIMDAMAIAHEMGKPQWVQTCSDIADHFCDKLQQKTSTYDEVHVIFDRYDLPNSLKEKTRKR